MLASALHHMVLDGYDVTGEDVGFNFHKGRVLPWRNGEDLMKYIKKVGLFHWFLNLSHILTKCLLTQICQILKNL